MTTSLRRFALTASTVAALVCAAGASAHPEHPPEGGSGPAGSSRFHDGARGPMGGHSMRRMPTAADVALLLDSQKTALALTAAQEPAWSSYAAVVRRQAEARDAQHLKMLSERAAELNAEIDALKSGKPRAAAASATPIVTPADHAMRHAERMKLHELQRAERQEALKGLLAVLTPEQKAKAEQALMPPHGGQRHLDGMTGMRRMRAADPGAPAQAEASRS